MKVSKGDKSDIHDGNQDDKRDVAIHHSKQRWPI